MNQNRPFKYRTWDPINKKMIYNTSIINGKPYNFNAYFANFYDRYIKDGIIMEYIGLNDKNKKEICEGDIISAEVIKNSSENLSKEVCQVIYNDNRTCYDIIGKGFRTYLWNAKTNIEIIVNIYENPELLEKNNVDNPTKIE